MDNFPPNSHKAKETEPREKIKPVTSATTERRKRGLGQKFKGAFFAGSSKDALSVMTEDVVVPAIRDAIRDALRAGIDNLIYGDTRRRGGGGGYSAPWSGQTGTPYVNYGGASKPQQQQTVSKQSRARLQFDSIIVPSREDAVEVIDQMFEILSRQGVVYVAELYALVDIRAEHTDWKWGWTNLRGTKPVPLSRDRGYLLNLPEPEELV